MIDPGEKRAVELLYKSGESTS